MSDKNSNTITKFISKKSKFKLDGLNCPLKHQG